MSESQLAEYKVWSKWAMTELNSLIIQSLGAEYELLAEKK